MYNIPNKERCLQNLKVNYFYFYYQQMKHKTSYYLSID